MKRSLWVIGFLIVVGGFAGFQQYSSWSLNQPQEGSKVVSDAGGRSQDPAGTEPAPVVLTCRWERYEQLPAIPREATDIYIQPLGAGQISTYLHTQFADVGEELSWQPLLDPLQQDGPVAHTIITILCTPWRLTQALAFARGGGHPAELLPVTDQDGVPDTEIDRITKGVEPLSDLYPKRLTDVRPNLETAFHFGYNYLERSAARRHFLLSSLIDKVWPNERNKSLELFFLVRETRYLSEMSGSNWLAELDLYLRHTRLRTPVLAVQDSDEFRLTLAEKLANNSRSLPVEALHDLVAGALALYSATLPFRKGVAIALNYFNRR